MSYQPTTRAGRRDAALRRAYLRATAKMIAVADAAQRRRPKLLKDRFAELTAEVQRLADALAAVLYHQPRPR
jgi:hypothetical protein